MCCCFRQFFPFLSAHFRTLRSVPCPNCSVWFCCVVLRVIWSIWSLVGAALLTTWLTCLLTAWRMLLLPSSCSHLRCHIRILPFSHLLRHGAPSLACNQQIFGVNEKSRNKNPKILLPPSGTEFSWNEVDVILIPDRKGTTIRTVPYNNKGNKGSNNERDWCGLCCKHHHHQQQHYRAPAITTTTNNTLNRKMPSDYLLDNLLFPLPPSPKELNSNNCISYLTNACLPACLSPSPLPFPIYVLSQSITVGCISSQSHRGNSEINPNQQTRHNTTQPDTAEANCRMSGKIQRPTRLWLLAHRVCFVMDVMESPARSELRHPPKRYIKTPTNN